ncbi:MAG TPA: hypothetical protein VI168_16000 [Croceibacterium sp.]
MSFRIVAGVGLGALVVPALASAQAGSGDAGRNWAAIAECGAIKNADRRHDCVDDVLQAAGVLSATQVAQEAREDFGRENRPEPPRPQSVAVPAPVVAPAPAQGSVPAQAAAEAPRRAADLDELVTTVASVRSIGYKRVRVTTPEGSVWDQTQAEGFNAEPKSGDRFSVERAAMNSFLCQIGRSSRYRCERID